MPSTVIDDNSSVSVSTAITDTDSPYTTQGENVIEVDTTTAAVTVTLASADAADAGRLLRVLDVGDNAETNNITINTEGSETIDPGGESSKTIAVDGGSLIFEADGTNWYVVGGSASGYKTTEVSAAYTTQGEDVILVNTSGGAVTVTLATADLSLDHPITIINLDGTNAVTVNTEGSETIDPNADSSKTITKAGWGVAFTSDGTNWDSGLAVEAETVTTDDLTINNHSAQGIKNSTQDIPSGATTDVTLDAADFEDSSVFTVDTTNDDVEVLVAARVHIFAALEFSESLADGTDIQVLIKVNGSVVRTNRIGLGASNKHATGISALKALAANDKVTYAVFHDHGSARLLAGSERNSLGVSIGSQ